MKDILSVLANVAILLCFNSAFSKEHCYKFHFYLKSNSKIDDTLVFNTISVSYEVYNCGDTSIILGDDRGVGFEDVNRFFLYFYKVTQVDTFPYCEYLWMPVDNGDEKSSARNVTVTPGSKKTFSEMYINPLFYTVDAGEYVIKAVLKLKLNDNSGYYYQESENKQHVIIKHP